MSSGSQPPTYRSIAVEAGVSASTVSLALRDDQRISEPVRARVRAVAEAMGYRPNPLLAAYQASVRTRKPAQFQATLAWINDSPDRDFWKSPWMTPLCDGARRRAEKLGFLLDEIWTPPSEDGAADPKRMERVLRARGISGVILPLPGNVRLMVRAWEGFSVVGIGYHHIILEETQVPAADAHEHHTAGSDYFYNMHLACRKLREAGRKRIGLAVSDYVDRITDTAYSASYLRTQMDLPPSQKVPILFVDPTVGNVAAWVKEHKPDAVICADPAVREGIERAGFRVPEDVRVAHMNLATDVEGWSGIDRRLEMIASTAVDIITAHMIRNETGVPEFAKKVSIEGVWVEGKT